MIIILRNIKQVTRRRQHNDNSQEPVDAIIVEGLSKASPGRKRQTFSKLKVDAKRLRLKALQKILIEAVDNVLKEEEDEDLVVTARKLLVPGMKMMVTHVYKSSDFLTV
jgi:hypothetical protein